MPESRLHTDITIIGAGIAGLWTLHALTASGYSAVLIEREAIAAAQTSWSQGILHSGLKYQLSGSPSASSRGIADAPRVWAACLDGEPHYGAVVCDPDGNLIEATFWDASLGEHA